MAGSGERSSQLNKCKREAARVVGLSSIVVAHIGYVVVRESLPVKKGNRRQRGRKKRQKKKETMKHGRLVRNRGGERSAFDGVLLAVVS
jgi:hypothetical protein